MPSLVNEVPDNGAAIVLSAPLAVMVEPLLIVIGFEPLTTTFALKVMLPTVSGAAAARVPPPITASLPLAHATLLPEMLQLVVFVAAVHVPLPVWTPAVAGCASQVSVLTALIVNSRSATSLFASVTRATKVKEPRSEAVPMTLPEEPSINPGGSVPEALDHVKGALPPVTPSVAE